MELIPAIDLLDGKVVRLAQGDFERATIYSDDPVGTAQLWVEQGARRLHLVDLDGARRGHPTQVGIVASIIAAVGVPCQVAGGIRDATAVERSFAAGADRVVLGTALLERPELAFELVARHGAEHIVAAIDVREGQALGSGWGQGSAGVSAMEALARLRQAGIDWFAVTAIERDGVLEGPDLGLLDQAAGVVPARSIIASAGIGTLDDVRILAARGFGGAILGRALYESTIRLAETLSVASASAASRQPSR